MARLTPHAVFFECIAVAIWINYGEKEPIPVLSDVFDLRVARCEQLIQNECGGRRRDPLAGMNAALNEYGCVVRLVRQLDAFDWQSLKALADFDDGDDIFVPIRQIVEPSMDRLQVEIVIPVHILRLRVRWFDCGLLLINLLLEIGCLEQDDTSTTEHCDKQYINSDSESIMRLFTH